MSRFVGEAGSPLMVIAMLMASPSIALLIQLFSTGLCADFGKQRPIYAITAASLQECGTLHSSLHSTSLLNAQPFYQTQNDPMAILLSLFVLLV